MFPIAWLDRVAGGAMTWMRDPSGNVAARRGEDRLMPCAVEAAICRASSPRRFSSKPVSLCRNTCPLIVSTHIS
jgi:hypothetical protein